jgi:transposase
MILDGAGSHQQNAVGENSSLHLEKLPSACPELNPLERFFQELRRELSNQVFETIEEMSRRYSFCLPRYWNEPNTVIR